jgi:hypothetical protein
MYSIISSKENLQQIREAIEDEISYMKSGKFNKDDTTKIFNELIRFNFSTLILDLDSFIDSMELITNVKKFRIINPKVRIIILAINRIPGDKYISSLVKLGIYDILAPKIEEDQEVIILPYLIEIINKDPALYSNAARWDTQEYIDLDNKSVSKKTKGNKKRSCKSN